MRFGAMAQPDDVGFKLPWVTDHGTLPDQTVKGGLTQSEILMGAGIVAIVLFAFKSKKK